MTPMAPNVSRAAVPGGANVARAAAAMPQQRARAAALPGAIMGANVARSGTAQVARSAAPARGQLFMDVSALGPGFEGCRNAWNTCMDQLCGMANDTFRRCACSERITYLRQQHHAMDQAVNMLADFEMTNLWVVGMSRDEVQGAFSASEGERALERNRDTSESMRLLESIGDILSGRSVPQASSPASMSISSVGLFDISNIWNDSGADMWG